jgi:hypothetical protein
MFKRRKKCQCGDDAYKIICHRPAKYTDTLKEMYVCCVPCVNRLMHKVENSWLFRPGDVVVVEDLVELFED